MLSDRNVQLLLGYFVKAVKRAADVESLDQSTDSGNISMKHDAEELVVELQPAQRGLQGQNLEADLVLWTVGNKPRLPQLEPCYRPHLLPLNGIGQAETIETLQVKGNPRIFALGDSSSLRDSSGKLLPPTAQVLYLANFFFISIWPLVLFYSCSLTWCFPCHYTLQVAFQQADFAGWNIWAAINDRPLLPFRLDLQPINFFYIDICGYFEQAAMPIFTFGTFPPKFISFLQNYITNLVNSTIFSI